MTNLSIGFVFVISSTSEPITKKNHPSRSSIIDLLTWTIHRDSHVDMNLQFTIMIPIDSVIIFQYIVLECNDMDDTQDQNSQDRDNGN